MYLFEVQLTFGFWLLDMVDRGGVVVACKPQTVVHLECPSALQWAVLLVSKNSYLCHCRILQVVRRSSPKISQIPLSVKQLV